MFTLIINDTAFPLPAGLKIPFSLKTNVLSLEPIDPSFTLPIDLPATQEVMTFFGFAHKPQSNTDMSVIYENATLKTDLFTFQGAVQLLEADRYNYSITFRFASGYITSVVRGEKLREHFADETVTIPSTVTHKYDIQWIDQINVVSVNVVVNGLTYSEPIVTTNEAALNALAITLQLLSVINVCSFDNGTFIMNIESLEGVKPTITAYETVELPDGMGGTYQSNQGMVISTTEEILLTFPDLGQQYFLPTMYMPGFYDNQENDGTYTGFVNLYENGNYLYTKTPDPFDLTTTIVPCLSRKWLLETFLAKFSITLDGDAMADDNIAKMHELVPRSIDTEMYATDTSGSFQLNIPVADLLADITVGEWLKSFKIIHCLSTSFRTSNKTLYLNKIQNLLTAQPTADWTPYLVNELPVNQNDYQGLKVGFSIPSDDTEVNERQKERKTIRVLGSVEKRGNLTPFEVGAKADDAYFVKSKNGYYRWNIEPAADPLDPPVKSWYFHSHNFDDYYHDKEQDDVRTVYAPVADVSAAEQGQFLRVPKLDVAGYSIPHGLDQKDYAPRLSIYRGMQPGSAAVNYPMSSVGTYLENETIIPGATAICFAWHDQSLDKLYHKDWLALQVQKKQLRALFRLPARLLYDFDLTKKIRVAEVNYLVHSINAELTESGLTLAEITMTKVT